MRDEIVDEVDERNLQKDKTERKNEIIFNINILHLIKLLSDI